MNKKKVLEGILDLGMLASFSLPLWKPIATKFEERPKEWTYLVQIAGTYALGLTGHSLDKSRKKSQTYEIKFEDYNIN